MRLGKKPFVPDGRDLRLADYTPAAPVVPAVWGYDNIYPRNGWGMLGNDNYGDCVWAGAAHEHMLVNKVADHPVVFDTSAVLSDYAAVTGFDPNDPSTDQGTDVRTALKYRQQSGIRDASGNRHKIGAFLALDVNKIKAHDFSELDYAAYVFGAVGLGIEFPSSAMDQFRAGREWKYVPGSAIEGGHYIPYVARRKHREIITWSRVVPVGDGFLAHYVDEAWAMVSPEFLNSAGVSPLGFDLAQLNADLAAL